MSPRNGGGLWHRTMPNKEVFGEPDRGKGTVPIDVGHGQMVEVKAGSDFVNTIEQVARDYNYGGYFKVFLAQNGGDMREIINPADAPDKLQAGMRLAITSYDKVGA